MLGRVKNPDFIEGDTEFGEHPWHAAILQQEAGEVKYVCGGALVDSQHVVTAAHCVSALDAAQLRVRLGEWDVHAKQEFFQHVEQRAAALVLHPEFYAGNLANDLAVIRLERPVDLINK